MRRLSFYFAATMLFLTCAAEQSRCLEAGSSDPKRAEAVSEVYIKQAHGRVAAKEKSDSAVTIKPTPEVAVGSPSTDQTGPATCNSQNSASAACYTATQQARPATR
jgi:hypothetical protein